MSVRQWMDSTKTSEQFAFDTLATIDSQIVERVSYGLRAIISESR
jgi:hypothetical protein